MDFIASKLRVFYFSNPSHDLPPSTWGLLSSCEIVKLCRSTVVMQCIGLGQGRGKIVKPFFWIGTEWRSKRAVVARLQIQDGESLMALVAYLAIQLYVCTCVFVFVFVYLYLCIRICVFVFVYLYYNCCTAANTERRVSRGIDGISRPVLKAIKICGYPRKVVALWDWKVCLQAGMPTYNFFNADNFWWWIWQRHSA